MDITIDKVEFVLPDKILNRHLVDIGIGNLMKLGGLSEGTPEKIDEAFPIFLKFLKVLGISDIYELQVGLTFKLFQAPEFQKWMESALGFFF